MEKKKIAITISRQLGSGGAYIGQQLANILGISYLDREIIRQAAEHLSLSETDLESHDEKISSFWGNLFKFGYITPDAYVPPKVFVPSDKELFLIESEIIKHNAGDHSVVIIGRCGSHILRDHPNHIGVFLHADVEFRFGRVQELYNVSRKAAFEMIVQSDSERARYHQSLTGKEWANATQYDLSIDTGKIGVDNAVQIILKYLESVKPAG